MTITRKTNSVPQTGSTLLAGPQEVTAPIFSAHAMGSEIRAKTSPETIREDVKAATMHSAYRIGGEQTGIRRKKRAETAGNNHPQSGWTGFSIPTPLNLASDGPEFRAAGGRTAARLSSVWHSPGNPMPGRSARQGATPVGVPTWTRLHAREEGPWDA